MDPDIVEVFDGAVEAPTSIISLAWCVSSCTMTLLISWNNICAVVTYGVSPGLQLPNGLPSAISSEVRHFF